MSRRYALRGLVALCALFLVEGYTLGRLEAQVVEEPENTTQAEQATDQGVVEESFGQEENPAEENGRVVDEAGEAEKVANDTVPAANATGDALRELLANPVQLEVEETPLTEFVERLEDRYGIEIVVDVRALEDVGVDPGSPISIDRQNISLAAALRYVLRPLDLTWGVKHDALVITTHEAAEVDYQITRVYPVADLLVAEDNMAATSLDAECPGDALIDVIVTTIEHESWAEVGGPGEIRLFDSRLVVTQSESAQEEVAALLAALREAMTAEEPGEVLIPPAPGAVAQEAQAEIDAALEQPISLKVEAQALADVLRRIEDRRGIPVAIDVRALQDVGIDPATPVTVDLEQVPLRSALAHMLRPLDLTWTIQNEMLTVTTEEEAELIGLRTRLYRVEGLVEQAEGEGAGYDALIDTIVTTIASDSWAAVGGPGSIRAYQPAKVLVVAQTPEVHEEIGRLLTALRETRDPGRMADDGGLRWQLQIYQLTGAREEIAAEQLANVLRELTGPEQWQEDAYLRVLGDRLIVRQQPAVQRRIATLLSELGLWQERTVQGGLGLGGGRIEGGGTAD